MDDADKAEAPRTERALRVTLARLRRHLPATFKAALESADDLMRFSSAAIKATYLKALSEPDYIIPPPIPPTPGTTGWKPLGNWIDAQHERIGSACVSYRSHGRRRSSD